MTADLPQDQTEIERLRAENEALKQQLAAGGAGGAGPAPRHRVRAVIAAVLAFLTGLLMITAVVSVWTTRTAFNTEKFVARVGPIIEEPAVQDAIATEVSTQLAGYLQPKVAEALPENLQFLAAPITSGLQTVIDKQVRKIIDSEAFTKVWDQALTLSHQELVSVLKGENQAVAVVNGKVVIDLIPVVNEVLQNLSAQLPTIFGQTISLQLPENASLDRIRSAVSTYLGVELPPDFAQIPIANESDLTAAQGGVKVVNTSTVLVVLLALLAFVLAVVIAPARRRTLLQIGLWTTTFTALVFFVVRGVMSNAVAGVDPAYLADAATAALKTLFSSLREFALILFWAGLVLAVVMYLIGPGRFPVWLRTSVARWTRTGVAKVREASQDEGFSAWLRQYLDPLRIGGGVVAALVLLIWPSWTALLVVGILLVLFEVGVTLAAHPTGGRQAAR